MRYNLVRRKAGKEIPVSNFRVVAASQQVKEKGMNRKNAILLVLMTVFIFALTLVGLTAAPANKKLKVKVNYTGAGIVDEKHKIYVMLFDANPFTASKLEDDSSAPTPPVPAEGTSHILRRQSASSKNGAITFTDLSISPVYAAAFFDKNGSYDGHSDPVSGSPMGVYGKAVDKAEPITLGAGKAAEVVLAFDDSIKTP
jgi:hypothetical protein